MKAAIINDDKILIKDIEKPMFATNQQGAIIKIFGCGLCGSDIVKFKQNPKNGTVLGHEVIGEIVEIDSNTSFAIGDKIAMGHHVPCYNCIYCKNENFSMCRHFKETNIVPGGFSQYIYASEEHLENTVFKIPENMNEITASFTEPLACCIRAVKRASLIQNSTAVVVGLGSIGLLMGQALKAYGMRVIGCDLLASRLKMAKDYGFDEVVLSDDIDRSVEFIKKNTQNYGADAIFMTSGAHQTIPLAINAVRDGGKIIVFSSVKSMNGYSNNDIYYRELTITGSYSPSPDDLKEALELLKNNKIMVNNFSIVYNLENIELAFKDTMENKILKAYIKI